MAELFNSVYAVRLGIHAALLLAGNGRLTISELAQRLGCSAAHLAKVLGQLERAGIVHGKTGPGGGYQLARKPEAIPLLAIYETIAGKLTVDRCPFAIPVCTGDGCPLGPFFRRLNRQGISQLKNSSLKAIKIKPGVFNAAETKNNQD